MKTKVLIILITLIGLSIGGFLVVKELGLPGGPLGGPPRDIKPEIHEPQLILPRLPFFTTLLTLTGAQMEAK